jgi:dihydrofolate reductase
VDIPSQLIALGLVDEFRFVVMAVLAGKGRRLFEGISVEKLRLKLVESRVFKSSGSVVLRYLKQ